ncbi:hypothetical protein [Sporosarcina sp. FSL K6-2383]|uniref:hypothetical protein n=1 Tax=Sporosarcina sp. FSL K6-2383 TaxID=2921556 RepID=UPI003159F19F
MTELELYKFCQDKEIGWRGESLIMWISPSEVQEFADLIDRCSADDGGLDCKIQQDGTVCVDLIELCEEYDIDPENILPKEEQ